MNAPTERSLPKRERTDEAGPSSPRPVPRIIRRLTSQFEWRHVKGLAAWRVVLALWLLFLGSILLAYGYWWGASLYLGAGLAGWLAYQMPRWKLVLDGETDVKPS